MNCSNCGGLLSDVGRHGVVNCQYCGSQRLLSSGEGLDGVVLLGGPCDLDCPACNDQLVTAIVDDIPCRACPTCFGVAISQAVLGDLISRRRAGYQGADRTAAPLDSRLFEVHRDCPICREEMEIHPYYGPGNTVIDSCSNCRLVWLDVGELAAIEQAPGRR